MGMMAISGWRAPRRSFVLRWSWALLVANVLIVLTGGLVRLTASGLGCPEWPRCTEDSFVAHSSLGIHGVIEFGNRLLTYVLIAIAIAAWVAVLRWSASTSADRRLVTGLLLGIPFQGVIGGITVLTDLNPWIVALHLVLSLVLIAGSTVLVARVGGHEPLAVSRPARILVWALYAVLWAAVYVGTIVTGSGPHAGDLDVPRNGLRPDVLSQIHADIVFALVALTVAALWSFRADPDVRRWVVWVLVAELGQGLIGVVQYRLDLPILLVAAHLVGAAVLVSLATRLVLSTGGDRGVQRRKGSAAAATKSSAR